VRERRRRRRRRSDHLVSLTLSTPERPRSIYIWLDPCPTHARNGRERRHVAKRRIEPQWAGNGSTVRYRSASLRTTPCHRNGFGGPALCQLSYAALWPECYAESEMPPSRSDATSRHFARNSRRDLVHAPQKKSGRWDGHSGKYWGGLGTQVLVEAGGGFVPLLGTPSSIRRWLVLDQTSGLTPLSSMRSFLCPCTLGTRPPCAPWMSY